MSSPTLRIISSPDELRSERQRWDRLWRASESTLPTLQAELLAAEFEHFFASARLRTIAIEHEGKFVAGLPLVESRGRWGWKLSTLPGSSWFPAADLLLDSACDAEDLLPLLIAGLRRARVPLVDFHAIDLGLDRWRRWECVLRAYEIPVARRERFPVALLRIGGGWSKYVDSLKGKHRQQMRRMEKLADRNGGAELRVLRDLAPAEVEGWLRRGFGVEDRNWKGAVGSSVLRSPGMFDFYVRQAEALASKGQLHLTFLEKQGRPIAFEYGFGGKGGYYAVKVGYDAEFSEYTPSQLLRWRLFERFFDENRFHTVDFFGPNTRAIACWSNDQYVVNRMLVAPGRSSGRLALQAYEKLWPRLRRGVKRQLPESAPATGDPVREDALVEV